MRVTNHTPFPMLCFEGRGIHDEPFDTVVTRLTFELGSHRVLRLSQDQPPLAFRDEWNGEVARSSVRAESDLAPSKPSADVVVAGSARAPGGVAARSWPVRVKVGAVEKTLRVTGPRAWVRGANGYALSEPEGCTEVALRYENAFGGAAREGDQTREFEGNPWGVGYVSSVRDERRERIDAPRIEDPRDPVTEFGKTYRPEGFGVWGRTWAPRLERAGTFDESWLRERWPVLPPDFDFAYWNCAHPDLIAPTLFLGDEAIELDGVDPAGPRRHWLPGHEVFLLAGDDDDECGAWPMRVDTVLIDLDRAKVSLVYRRVLPRPQRRWLELRMEFRDPEETEASLGGG